MKNEMVELQKILTTLLPDVVLVGEMPSAPNGTWYLNVTLKRRTVIVQWNKNKGFGVTRARKAILGEGCHEVYADVDAVAQRVADLIDSGAYTTGFGERTTATRIRTSKDPSQAIRK